MSSVGEPSAFCCDPNGSITTKEQVCLGEMQHEREFILILPGPIGWSALKTDGNWILLPQ